MRYRRNYKYLIKYCAGFTLFIFTSGQFNANSMHSQHHSIVTLLSVTAFFILITLGGRGTFSSVEIQSEGVCNKRGIIAWDKILSVKVLEGFPSNLEIVYQKENKKEKVYAPWPLSNYESFKAEIARYSNPDNPLRHLN